MQLPQEFQAFERPTLIVVTDNVQAKLYRALGHEVSLVHTISTKADVLEGERVEIMTGSGDVRSGEPEDDRKEWSREKLYDQLSEELMRRLKAGEFESLAVCVPEEHMNELKESLHVDLLKIADAWVRKNLANDDLLDIVIHVQESE
ncbi:hypothetical protein A2348_01800 [Candidatus Uhrbacteria bacterium RIFOXYB12_FULL_58_10]|uniref:Host attachment protein n=1 Tax=Candidatus Uhrbacteria bacterium RIFOXYB2_FULL_57_15 TaxID=1802422 RepID=A0A1F7W4W0_9BACT|nr:MAG: hypothetical protein A2348_01800 [Candidatus Uhrbacteria bacterium RIFOXYB12_FULL_58_10]OGL97853.1 MAG: hypothetical protein A2304_04705 [Candidatus Uhrbacteria bacterium RIFOXYB2_FULL_57_15]OGM00462.1 MAG: hypothetical protein A2501_00670 [Candidatus Uhrbacteria bacterium RIFOXYC12_FULL_57_11]